VCSQISIFSLFFFRVGRISNVMAPHTYIVIPLRTIRIVITTLSLSLLCLCLCMCSSSSTSCSCSVNALSIAVYSNGSLSSSALQYTFTSPHYSFGNESFSVTARLVRARPSSDGCTLDRCVCVCVYRVCCLCCAVYAVCAMLCVLCCVCCAVCAVLYVLCVLCCMCCVCYHVFKSTVLLLCIYLSPDSF